MIVDLRIFAANIPDTISHQMTAQLLTSTNLFLHYLYLVHFYSWQYYNEN